ncbi:MAG: IclR family transcriptional regulator [Anaerolineae bacterium]
MSEVQTLARGLRVLELLAETEDGLSSTELAEVLEVDKSSMSRLMNTLVSYRFAERDEITRRYYLGTYIQELGRRAGQHGLLRDLVEPHLQRLSALTSENAHVAVYASSHALTIADVPSTEPLRVVSEVGRRVPLHCSAIGKCLLAFAEVPLPVNLARYTSRTIVSVPQLELQLEQIRYQNYALDDEELTLGVRGLAVPLRNREGRTIATIGLSGPSVRLTMEKIPELADLLIKSAQDISKELGFQLD